MSRGKKITKTVSDFIAREVSSHPNVDRRLLAIDLQHGIELMAEIPPTEETLMKMISSYRSKGSDDLDKPWTLAESLLLGFPIETTPSLLRTWRYSQALGKPFSIRQAKWASYLGTVISNISELYEWSYSYSSFEKGYKLRELDFNNSCDLDGSLMMSMFENATASLLGKIIPVPMFGGGILVSPSSVDRPIEDAYLASKTAEEEALSIIHSKSPDPSQASLDFKSDLDLLPSLRELELNETQIWIYVHWLTALSKGPKFTQMRRDEVIDFINLFRIWVSEMLPKIIKDIFDSIDHTFEAKEKISLKVFPYRLDLIPHYFVEKAGFTAESPENSPGQWQETEKRLLSLKIGKQKMDSRKRKKNITIESDQEEKQ
ncbi:hypothetical protein ACFLXV_03945 [Chloroflexota bacterium]